MRRAIRKHLVDFLAVVGLVALGAATAVYILSEQGLRFPLFESAPKRIEVVLENAQAVQAGAGQSVRVAGVQIGTIGDVRLEDGFAVVDLEIDEDYEEMVRADATALLRPKTALKDMFVEVDPGSGEVLPEGGRIRLRNTLPDVDPDEIYSALDADTQAYLRLLVGGAGKGLRGRGDDLREVFRRLSPLHRSLAQVTRATARRRDALKRLVHNYGLLMTELGRRPGDLRRLVTASNSVFDALASEDQNIAEATARLPGALRQSAATLGRVEGFAAELRPALDSLRPSIRRLDETNEAVRPFLRETTPVLRDEIRPFVRAARPWTDNLRVAAVRSARAAPDLDEALAELNRFFNMGAFNPGGAESLDGLSIPEQRARSEGFLYWLAWTAQNGVSLHNTADAQGPWRRVTICGTPQALVDALTASALAIAAREAPALHAFLTAPRPGGNAVQRLSASQFGGCDFNALPTTVPDPLPIPDLVPVAEALPVP
jgi:phospholipid/cholesterol/gamma-HCH transport system substrate-binding protein